MSTGNQTAAGDLAAPASKGELRLVQSDLNGKIDRVAADLNGRIDKVQSEIKGLRSDFSVELKDMEVRLVRRAWTAVATVGAVGILLRFF